MIRALLPAALICGIAAAQNNPMFEVAMVKPSGPDVVTRHFTIEGRRFLTFHTSLADLIQFAYGLHSRQIAGGPGWLMSRQFDVVGLSGVDHQPTEQEWMKMMANLLAERFQLRFHLEKRDLAVYAITVEKDGTKPGPRLEASGGAPDSFPSLGFSHRGQLVARNANVGDLAWELQSAVLDRPVVDQSGLAKRFNFTLTWTPDEFQTPAVAGDARTESQAAPNLFTALRQQLGLRLTATKSKVDVMVVDHTELAARD